MKIYVAARFAEKEMVNTIYDQLRTAGHEIAVDWTWHKNTNPFSRNINLISEYVAEDSAGIRAADVLILINSPEPGAGVSAELGIAIALHQTTGHPAIYVVGQYVDTNPFFFHPAVKRFDSLAQVIELLGSLS